MDSPSRDSELDKFSFEYDPEKAPQPKWKSILWTLAGVLLLVILSVAGTLGITKRLSAPRNASIEPAVNAEVFIAGTVGETALLLSGDTGAFSEIEVLSTTTDTFAVRDLTYGKFRALAAALAPQQDRLVYVREEDGSRAVIVVNLDSGSSTVVGTGDPQSGTVGAKTEPCSWSPVTWSPDGSRFCFFGCDKTGSVLMVVEAETELTPFSIKNTKAAQTPPRQVFWLNNENLLYTQFSASTGETQVNRISANAGALPLLVYVK
jgi:hypothetical protein